jgi:Fic family protein
MRTFERTHPWISFRIDLRKASPQLWMLLGEAASKCEHIAGVPLRPSVAQDLHRLYLAKGALATTAIEGNTLTEKQVLQHLEGKLKLPRSKEYLAQEIDNIVGACNRIGELLAKGDAGLTPERLCDFNRWVLEKLPPEGKEIPGRLRDYSVLVGNVYRGAPAEDCSYLLDRYCQWLASEDFKAPPGMEAVYAIIKAAVAHLYFAWIHPFGNGNGRTARLIELQILLAAGVPTPAAHLLSNHYNHTRAEYYRQLDQASKSGGETIPFIQYAAEGFVDGLREQLQVIREQQWDVAWRSYVHTKFRDDTRAGASRKRDLVLDLSASVAPVPVGKIPELSPRLAKSYATKSPKTLNRDLVELELVLGLIRRTPKGFVANREVILAFLPWRKTAPPKQK